MHIDLFQMHLSPFFFLLFLKLTILIFYNLPTSSAVVPSPCQSEFTGTNHTHGSSGIRNPDWSFGSYRSFFFFFLVCLRMSEKHCMQKNIFTGFLPPPLSYVEKYILQAHYQYQHNFLDFNVYQKGKLIFYLKDKHSQQGKEGSLLISHIVRVGQRCLGRIDHFPVQYRKCKARIYPPNNRLLSLLLGPNVQKEL